VTSSLAHVRQFNRRTSQNVPTRFRFARTTREAEHAWHDRMSSGPFMAESSIHAYHLVAASRIPLAPVLPSNYDYSSPHGPPNLLCKCLGCSDAVRARRQDRKAPRRIVNARYSRMLFPDWMSFGAVLSVYRVFRTSLDGSKCRRNACHKSGGMSHEFCKMVPGGADAAQTTRNTKGKSGREQISFILLSPPFERPFG